MTEKSCNAHGNLANAAIYILEPEVIDWISKNPTINDISTQVLPRYMGRISTWHNTGVHIDIGNIDNLKLAQQYDLNFKMNPLPYSILHLLKAAKNMLNTPQHRD